MGKKQRKTEQIGVRVTPELREELEVEAKKNIRSLSQQAEYYIRLGLEKDKATCPCVDLQPQNPTAG